MITLTKEWLQKTIAELEEERDATPGAVNEDAANALAAMKLALASLEAESKPKQPELSHVIYHFRDWNEGFPIERFKADYVISWMLANYPPAQPAPVSVPAAMEMDDDFDSAFEHGKAVGWNAYRAAMLQSFGNSEQLNSPVIQDGWVMVPEDPTHEMLEAGDEQFGTYDVYRRMIEAAPKLE
ncbi:hypothetical protein B7O37_000657 [Enterobacter roggenkampii]|nr:hypothetical protein [Enterobacter roggenkampii]